MVWSVRHDIVYRMAWRGTTWYMVWPGEVCHGLLYGLAGMTWYMIRPGEVCGMVCGNDYVLLHFLGLWSCSHVEKPMSVGGPVHTHRTRSQVEGPLHACSIGWLGRAMVLGSFQCRGVLLLWHMVGQGPAVLAAGAGWVGYVLIFSLNLVYPIFLF